jgi:Cys-tRNA(Pro) deacylase
MNSQLSPSARRVQAVLDQHQLHLTVVELPASTRTAQEAADAVGCDVRQIIKSLVFKTKHTARPILVIASGGNRVDEKIIAGLTGEKIGKADADFVRQQTGFVIGGVPPVGHAQPIETYIDQDLLAYEFLWAAAGTPNAVFRLTPQELLRIVNGRVAAIHPAD